jgi:transcriptional regulator with XRE-family HTH domain
LRHSTQQNKIRFTLKQELGILFAIMGRTTITPLPSLQRRLTAVGENLRLARLRRKLSATQIAERAGISRPTLRAIEQGDPSVSFGAYASVLFCLGLEQDLEALANDDELGRKLQDAELTIKRRAPRRPPVALESSTEPADQELP